MQTHMFTEVLDDLNRFVSRGILCQISDSLYFTDCFVTFILQNLGWRLELLLVLLVIGSAEQ